MSAIMVEHYINMVKMEDEEALEAELSPRSPMSPMSPTSPTSPKPKWEKAWSTHHKAWYYMDRFNGISSWQKPLGCTLVLPTEPPSYEEAPPAPCTSQEIPAGWKTEWDLTEKRNYYFKSTTGERTWDASNCKNGPELSSAARARIALQSLDADGVRRGEKWDSEEFRLKLETAKHTDIASNIEFELKAVAENNYFVKDKWPLPETVTVPVEALMQHRVSGFGPDPEMSFSTMTTADALLYFSHCEPNQVVCGLNFANGSMVGAGYLKGKVHQEEDLCRRLPNFYTTLLAAQRNKNYPFGPCTCTSPTHPGRYCDILWTPNVVLSRTDEHTGFAFLPADKQANVSIVSAAAPMLKPAEDHVVENLDRELLVQTTRLIMTTPAIKNPETTTLILGAWGCGQFGGDPKEICEMFLQALVDERLGRLYKKVHFAIPVKNKKDKNGEIFREVFRKRNIRFKEIRNFFGTNPSLSK